MPKISICLLLFIFALKAFSEVPQTASETETKKWNVMFDYVLETNMYKFSSPDHTADTSLEVTGVYQLGHGYSVGSIIGYSKDLEGERKGALADTAVFIKKILKEVPQNYTWAGSFSVILPTNEDSRKINTLRTGLKIGPAFSAKLDSIGLQGFDFKWSASLTWYFHKYKTTTDSPGEANGQRKIGSAVSMSYSFFEHFSLSNEFSFSQKWSYQGKTNGPAYSNVTSLGASFANKWDIAVGFSTKGSVYKPNGIDNNVSLYDSTKSLFFIEVVKSI